MCVVWRVNARMSECRVAFGVYIVVSGSSKTGTCTALTLLFVEICIAEHLSVVLIKLRSSLASHLGHIPRLLNIV